MTCLVPVRFRVVLYIMAMMLWVITGSCNRSSLYSREAFEALPKPGIIHRHIACKNDSVYSYALLIPATYKDYPPALRPTDHAPGEIPRFPVILAFDPHADGSLPLTLYRPLAEKYGYLMIGSNDLKNGLTPDKIQNIVRALAKEILTGYPVDTSRIYLLGFSGCARMASLTALYFMKVRGVIGCGAGFAGNGYAPPFKFDFFGMAGWGDFNIGEVLSLENPLREAGFRHHIDTWPGIHAWPPEEEMEQAFRWITLNAMRDRQILPDTALTGLIAREADLEITTHIRKGYLPDALGSCSLVLSCLQGLTSVASFTKRMDSIKQSPLFIRQQHYRDSLFGKEEMDRKELMNAVSVKEPSWWKEWMHGMKEKGKEKMLMTEGQDVLKGRAGMNVNSQMPPAGVGFYIREDTLLNRRILSFIGLYCYMQATAKLSGGNDQDAAKVINIYELIEPGNPEANYLRARLYARQGSTDFSLEEMKSAVEKGFNNISRIENQEEFKSLKTDEGFGDLIKSLKEKQQTLR